MGLCLHTVALFKDLKSNLLQVDNDFLSDGDFKRQMAFLISYHNQILDLMADIEATFSRLFFTQFVGTIFILCSQSYLATMVRVGILILAIWSETVVFAEHWKD